MPDLRRAHCIRKRGGCGRHFSEVGPISWGGLCGDCGPRKFIENADGLHTHSGPALERWRRGMAACAGGVLVDDLEALIDGAGDSA